MPPNGIEIRQTTAHAHRGRKRTRSARSTWHRHNVNQPTRSARLSINTSAESIAPTSPAEDLPRFKIAACRGRRHSQHVRAHRSGQHRKALVTVSLLLQPALAVREVFI